MIDALLARLRHYGSLVGAPPAETPLDERDAGFIAKEVGLIGPILDAWYAPEVSGLENVPEGRALTVGTHNGGYMAPDMFCTILCSLFSVSRKTRLRLDAPRKSRNLVETTRSSDGNGGRWARLASGCRFAPG
jgi:hypothetical protein